MIPEIGQLALIIALCLSIIQTFFPLVGAHKGYASWMALTKPVAQGQCVFVALAFVCLTYAFLQDDFSVLYAANHSNSLMPTLYKFAAVWGGHEGSMLLWILFLSLWTVGVTLFSRSIDDQTLARVVGVLGFLSIGFLLFLLLTSNPFERLFPAALDGRDLNPLLQDPGLVIHPPLLYMGYVGFSVAFAFAIAALISGRIDAAWARWSRPWTTAAWAFLTVGIALGSWWAYYELGWGGWWFWDPVENASFLPWIAGTALIHSLAVTDKRGTFRNWTLLLAITVFSLSLLGTFLVRSGVLVSVHAFATDPERGSYILLFLGIVIGISLALFAWRAPKVGFGGDFKLVSRESMLLTGNVMLSVTCGAVLLGTIYPLIHDAMGMGKLSVGEPYFNAVFFPLMVPVLFLMGVGPIAKWKQAAIPELKARLKWALLAGVIAAIVLPLLMGGGSLLVSFGTLLAGWVIASVFVNIVNRVNSMSSDQSVIVKLAKQPMHFWGMVVAHFGIGIFVLGVTFVKGFEQEKDVRMDVGDTITLSNYTFLFDGVVKVPGPNYEAQRGIIVVSKNDEPFALLQPEKRVYTVQTNPMTEAAIESTFFEQIYVSLGEPVGGGSWSVRLYYKPLVAWIWAGAGLMALGGLLAMTDKRYRLTVRRRQPLKSEKEEGLPKNKPSPAVPAEG